jgi:Na+-driven multidrug efflux pump
MDLGLYGAALATASPILRVSFFYSLVIIYKTELKMQAKDFKSISTNYQRNHLT